MKHRVLIADDEEHARSGLATLVSGWGYEVEEAADGTEALARAGDFHPGVVIADVVMPGLDGMGLLKSLAEVEPAACLARLGTATPAATPAATSRSAPPARPNATMNVTTRRARLVPGSPPIPATRTSAAGTKARLARWAASATPAATPRAPARDASGRRTYRAAATHASAAAPNAIP